MTLGLYQSGIFGNIGIIQEDENLAQQLQARNLYLKSFGKALFPDYVVNSAKLVSSDPVSLVTWTLQLMKPTNCVIM